MSVFVSLHLWRVTPCRLTGRVYCKVLPSHFIGAKLFYRRPQTKTTMTARRIVCVRSLIGCAWISSDRVAFSPVTSLSSDDAFDYDRAMSFAKCRAASLGMGAAMRSLTATLEADDPCAEERLSSVASKVIASISRCKSPRLFALVLVPCL